MEKDKALLFKALSDENRLKILKLLISGESCGCTLIDQLPITQPTLSYHLNLLNKAGLTTSKKEGTWHKHYVNYDVLDDLIKYLTELKDTKSSCNL